MGTACGGTVSFSPHAFLSLCKPRRWLNQIEHIARCSINSYSRVLLYGWRRSTATLIMLSSRTATLAALVLGGIIRCAVGFVVPTGSLALSRSSFGKPAPLFTELGQRSNLKARKAQGVRGLCATIPSVSQACCCLRLRATYNMHQCSSTEPKWRSQNPLDDMKSRLLNILSYSKLQFEVSHRARSCTSTRTLSVSALLYSSSRFPLHQLNGNAVVFAVLLLLAHVH